MIKLRHILLLAISSHAMADLPLEIDVLPDKNDLTIELSADYFNAYSVHNTTQALGIRYGLTNDTEAYTRATNGDNATLGINSKLFSGSDTTALLGFAELSKNKTKMVGLTAYLSSDPIVLSTTTGIQRSTASDLWFINPALGFAVNNEMSLSAGLNLNFIQSSTTSSRVSQTQLELGMVYSASKERTFSLKIQTDISDYTGSNISLKWLHKLNQ